jgi:hypothetical protein
MLRGSGETETAMKTIMEFKGYRTRIAYDEATKSFVQAPAAMPSVETPQPACGATERGVAHLQES